MKLVTYDWGLIESLVAGELLTNRLVESSPLQQHGNHHHPGQLCEWRPSGESHWAHLMYVHHQEGLGRGPSLPDIPCLNSLHLFTALFFNHGTIIYLRLVCCVKTLDNLGYYDVWFRWLCLYPYHIRRDQDLHLPRSCDGICGKKHNVWDKHFNTSLWAWQALPRKGNKKFVNLFEIGRMCPSVVKR